MKGNSVLKPSQIQSHVWLPAWWHSLHISQGGNQGLGPFHLHSCEQSLLAPVIPLTLLGTRVTPASKARHPASCLSLNVFAELPALDLMFLPKMRCSSGVFVTLIAKPGSVGLFFSPGSPLYGFPMGHTYASCREGCAFLSWAVLLQRRET